MGDEEIQPAPARKSWLYHAAVWLFDATCNALWWCPGVPDLWAFVANRTVSR